MTNYHLTAKAREALNATDAAERQAAAVEVLNGPARILYWPTAKAVEATAPETEAEAG